MTPAGPGRYRPDLLLRDLLHNVAGGTRLAFWLPMAGRGFRSRGIDALLLLALSFGLVLIDDYVYAPRGSGLNPQGLVHEAALYFLFFLSVCLVAGVRESRERTVPLAVALLATTPAGFVVSVLLLDAVEDRGEVAYYAGLGLYIAWYLSVVWRAIRTVLRPRPVAAVAGVAIYALFNIAPWFLLPGPPVWEPAGTESPAAQEGPPLEDLLLAQPRLLAQQAVRLLPQRPGVRDVYVIAVAGYAGEDVFLNEARHAQRAMEERYDAHGRSLLLANNPATFGTHPIAAAQTLEWAIARIAALMDTGEDLLVLFFTSHGLEGTGLQLDLDFHALAPLTPARLVSILDGAGVRWRAVIVSSCFSGLFAEQMAGPGTLVITAARADRSSFGCGHDGDYTYFGRAFIEDELFKGSDLVQAFDGARARVAAREQRERLTPSEPQMSLGDEIAPLLEELVVDLERRRRPPPEANQLVGLE